MDDRPPKAGKLRSDDGRKCSFGSTRLASSSYELTLRPVSLMGWKRARREECPPKAGKLRLRYEASKETF